MSSCITCGDHIPPEDDSEEHVFPNAIGGRRSVSGVLHRACNNEAGASWDADLAKQMNPLCLLLGIVRDRGISPPLRVQTTAGESFKLHSGGGLNLARPSVEIVESEKGTAIRLQARDKKEARKILNGFKQKRFANLDVEKILNTFDEERTYPKGAIALSFSFGGQIAGRSMVKTALTFAYMSGVDTRSCHQGLSYLRDETVSAPFGYFDARDLVRDRPTGMPFHAVAVTADPVKKTVQAYVEYFGAIRIVVSLSDSYDGPAVHQSYAIDPLTGLEFEIATEPFAFTTAELEAIYSYKQTSPEAQKANFTPIMYAAMKRHFNNDRDQAISEAVQFAFANCGAKEGDQLTEEQMRKLGGLIGHHLSPFFLRHMVRRQPPLPLTQPAD